MRKWDDLPSYMKNKEVREYYDLLIKKQRQIKIKRYFDIILSSVLIVLLLPLFIYLFIAIKRESSGPAIFKQIRVTQYGKKFTIYKFRTMVTDAEKKGSQITSGEDSRITKIGSKLRKCRLDELPQLINILKGDMSFVGTRPEVPNYVVHYNKLMRSTLLMPAGVTSATSIRFKDEDKLIDEGCSKGKTVDEVYIGTVLPRKMNYNLKALREFSLLNDLRVMVGTVVAVVK